MVASANAKINSLKELVARAKAAPGTLNYGSVGIGSSQHLAGEYFAQVTGTKLTHVPYRNIAQYGPDLIAGTVPLGFQWFPNVSAPIQGGGAKVLGVAGDERLAALPDAPTTTEAGLPEYKISGWFALAAPARHAAPDPRAAQQGTDRGAARIPPCGRRSRRPARRRSRSRSTPRRNSMPTRSCSIATSSPRRVSRRLSDAVESRGCLE